MTNQEAFDKMIVHLNNQNWVQSVNKDGECAYRGPAGNKCAVGELIPDDQYDPEWDVEGISADYLMACNVPCLQGLHARLLTEMQLFHDAEMDRGSKARYTVTKAIASRFGLEFNYDEEFFKSK